LFDFHCSDFTDFIILNRRMFQELELMLPERSHDGPMQMALDEVLLRSARKPLLRIYRWDGPCVSFGYFQKQEIVKQIHPILPSVRRWTGGGIVEHGEDHTFSLILPKGEAVARLSPVDFYRQLHGCLAGWVSVAMCSEVRLAGSGETKSGPACFSAPARDDLLAQGRKILGGALRRNGGCLLYQGSLSVAGAKEWNPEGMASAISLSIRKVILSDAHRKEAAELVQIRYRSQEWNGLR